MHPKQIVYGQEAREKLLAGVEKMARAVTTTLSPKGRNVALGQPFGQTPKVIHDGVSVAKEIVLEDAFENMGALLAREAAEKTNDEVGDGTTTAILLTQKITSIGMKLVNNGANPMLMKNGIDKAVAAVCKEIQRLSTPLKHADWEKVATLSAQNSLIGKKIVEALELVGDSGMIEIQEGKSTEIVIEHKEGMTYDSGYSSVYFCKSKDELVAEIKDAYILITDYNITKWEEIGPLLEKLVVIPQNAKGNIVIIADGMEDEVLNALIVNKMGNRVNVLVPRAPYFGARRRAMMSDIAAMTGGKVVSEQMGMKLTDPDILNHLGRADLVKSDKSTTSIIGGKGDPKAIEQHIKGIRAEREAATLPHEKEATTVRLARMTGGVALIMVGASSESEMKNLKERVIDAKGATLAAIKTGIVAGGGVTLLQAIKVLDGMAFDNEDEVMGAKIIEEVAQEPLKLLASNAGNKNPERIVFQVLSQKDPKYGYNVLTGEYGDMIKMGIIEPAGLAVASLKYAASAASMILTTDCLVNDAPEAKKNG